MKIGIPKEIKQGEYRVGMTPAGVSELIKHGHAVFVQQTAGEMSGFSDDDYLRTGAVILPTMEDVYATADMIIKVKEPIEPEYSLIRKGQLVYTYFHFASDRPLTEAMIKSEAVCLAYETVETSTRSLPLLVPMSEVAGRMAALNGAFYLQKTKGGSGKLIGGVPGVKPVRVLVLGGGTVGEAAARMAAGMGAEV
ncbi:MAG: alanine dehydrogenase, partial [Prevotellaceae bacterium]|nr:alanine dehydrogenase [Prevotellaceae bacterium]